MTIDLSACSFPERHLFETVLGEVLPPNALKLVHPQYEFVESDGTRRRLDFAIVTPSSRIAIELDGYAFHAEDAIGQERFAGNLKRQNELVLSGWVVLRWSWLQIQREPELCRDQLRRATISDPALHASFRTGTPVPHRVQDEALAALALTRKKGFRKGLVVLATGLGKTLLAAFDAKSVGGRVLFVVHNNAILAQAREAFGRVWPQATTAMFNSLERGEHGDIVFANIASLRDPDTRPFRPRDFAYVIVDEFHHGATAHYRTVIEYFKPEFLLGLTATPNRTDRQSILQLVDNNLVYELGQEEAIRRGFLSPFHYYALKDNVDYSDIRHNGYRYDLADLNRALVIQRRDDAIIERYQALAEGRKAIAFCVTIEHTMRAAAHFGAAGIASVAIHSRMPAEEQADAIRAFREGRFQVAFVRDLFNEGIDVPDVEALLFMRPTESKIVFTQQLGRGLRLAPGKVGVVVLDFIGNYVKADRILEYLGGYRDDGNQGPLTKPKYLFDNGCSVTFDTSVYDLITKTAVNAHTHAAILQDFFAIRTKLRRTPTLADIHKNSRYSVASYLAVFNGWGAFVSRVLELDATIDARQLQWPDRLQGRELDSYADILECEPEYFDELLERLLSAWKELALGFDRVAKPFGSTLRLGSHARQKATRLSEVRPLIEALEQASRDVLVVLTFRLSDFPTSAPSAGVPDGKDAEMLAKVLTARSRLREGFTLARSFWSLQVDMQRLSIEVQAYRCATRPEADALTEIGSGARRAFNWSHVSLQDVDRLTEDAREADT
ncbi:MAG: DEAD/DEAH box helicase family protein [Pseudomonadota bacterium]|nr:DEAD/DEAH box helicase family protein [Pseudomonadota bacterium]